jgi:hypothetical protein
MKIWYEVKNNKLLKKQKKDGRGDKNKSVFTTYVGNLKDAATQIEFKKAKNEGLLKE